MEQQGQWFGTRLVCYPQELQRGEGREPWVSLNIVYPKERPLVAERGCRGRSVGALHAWCCDCASSPQRGMEEQAMG